MLGPTIWRIIFFIYQFWFFCETLVEFTSQLIQPVFYLKRKKNQMKPLTYLMFKAWLPTVEICKFIITNESLVFKNVFLELINYLFSCWKLPLSGEIFAAADRLRQLSRPNRFVIYSTTNFIQPLPSNQKKIKGRSSITQVTNEKAERKEKS